MNVVDGSQNWVSFPRHEAWLPVLFPGSIFLNLQNKSCNIQFHSRNKAVIKIHAHALEDWMIIYSYIRWNSNWYFVSYLFSLDLSTVKPLWGGGDRYKCCYINVTNTYTAEGKWPPVLCKVIHSSLDRPPFGTTWQQCMYYQTWNNVDAHWR